MEKVFMIRPTLRARWCLLILPALVALGGIVGCSQVRIIRDTPDGGVVSIPNNSNQWPTYYRNRAEFLMHQKCPEGYAIVREQVEQDNPAARDGRKPYEDFEYNGAYQRIQTASRQVYLITFRRRVIVPSDPNAAGREISTDPPVSPPLPATKQDQEELPPPRPLPPNL
jgi:hypothetical protein